MNRSKELTNRFHSITSDTIRTYVDKLIQTGCAQDDISHKLTSIQKFISWAYYSDKISFSAYQQIKDEIDNISYQYNQSPSTEALNSPDLQVTDTTLDKPHILSRFVDKIRAKNPVNEMVKDNNIPSGITSVQNRPFIFISMALLLLAVSVIGQGIYTRFFSSTEATLAFPSTPVVASRILSFQGRLTDSLGNPIVAATNMRFRLYTLSAGGTTLYDSGTCSISPDQDGVHNVLIGSDCGAEVSSSVFTENGEVYLGVTVGSDSEMTPRQRIANVPYAQNSETLQGFPLGTEVSTVPYINSGGDLLIAAASPQIASTYASQAFVISSAQAVSLQSAGAGDVTLTATGSGELKFLVGGASAGVVNNSGNWGIKSSNPSTFELQVNGDVGPETDSTFDLGSNSVRWANVYADNIIGTITPGFTTGSVTFADGSGNLAQDNAQFFWDDTNNTFGIGTSTPLAKFHLTGAATGKALAILNETGNQNILTASASGVTVANLDRSGNLSVEGALSDLSGATLEVNDNLDISGTLTSGTANAFFVDATGNISTSGTTGLTFSSTGGVNLAGGTLSDSSDGVDINDDLEISGGTTLGDASGDTVTANAASWTFANDTNYILSGGINGFSLDSTTFSVDGTNDRIGIGTAAPDAAWLDIAAATTAKSQLNLTTSAGTDVSAPNSGDLWWNGTNLYFYDGSGNNDLLSGGGGTPGGSDGQVQYNNGGAFGGASAFIYDDTNNRIGIGSATSPTTILHVAGAETGKALSIFNETGDQAILTASASGVTRYTLSNNGNITYSPAAYGTPITLYASDTSLPNANTGIVDAINDAYAAAIGGGGGLWTDSTTTTYLTTTTDDLVLGGSAPLSSAKLSIDGDADQIQLIVQGNGTQTSNLATFEQSDGTDVLTVTNGGNLSLEGAINDISGNLSLNDSTDITGNLTISGTTQLGDNSADTVTSNAAAWTFASDTDVTLSGGVNGLSFDGTTFSVDATGNKIGIGNAAPVGKLDVSGAVTGKALTILNETGDQDILVGSASGNTRFRVTNDGTVHAGYLLDISNTAYGIDPAGTGNFGGYSMKVTGGALLAFDSGSVGIGATSPTGKLQVVGDETRFGDAGSVDIATGDGDVYIEDALEVDGTITAGDIACTDCLDFTEFADSMSLDATTDINLGANNLTIDLDSTGIFDIRDGTTTFVSFDDDSTIDVTFPVAGTLGIDAAAADNTTTAGVINLDVDTATSGNIGSSIDYQVIDAGSNLTTYAERIDVTVDTDAGQSHTVNGSYIGLTANDASSTTYGLHIVGEDAGGQVATAGILIENLQATDIDLTTGLLIRATTDGSLPTAIDVSDNEITTALSVGANTIAGTTGLIDYTNFDVDASGNVTIAGTTGVTFSSTGGINLAGGVLIDSSDGVDINDNLEIAGGTVSLTNGTSDLIDWGSDGAADPSTTSVGWKTKFYGDAYGLGVAGSTLWAVSDDTFKLYDNDSTTYNLKTTIGTNTDTYFQLYDDSLNEDIRFHTNGTSWFNGGGLVVGSTATSARFQVVGDESRFGTAGTISNATGDGDVYIQDALEVDGLAYFSGGTIHLDNGTSDLINWGSDGAGDPSTSSSGWKTKFYGDAYGLGVAGGAMWSVSDDAFRWYDNDATTYNWKANLSLETDAYMQLYNNSIGTAAVVLHTNGTSYFNGGSLGVGTTGPDAKIDSLATTEQLRLTYTDGSVYAGFTTSSGGDLTINVTGGQFLLADTDVFNIGAVTGLSYNAISDSGTTSHSLASDDDLYVEGDFEVDGTLWADGAITSTGTITGADFVCTDCLDFAEFEDTLDLDTTLIVNQSTNTWTQNFTGDTTNGLTYTADSLSTGNAVAISSTSTALSAGTLLSLDWSPASLVTNGDDLFKINTTTNGNMSAYYINLLKNSSSVFNVDQSGNVNAANILPRTNDTYDLGSDSFRWKDIYLGGETMHIGTSTTDEATLGYTTSSNLLTLTNNYGDTTFTTSSDGFNFVLGGGAGDDLIVDTDTLVVESDNNRVGIGTDTPAEKLHVAGNVLVDAQSDATAHNFASGCNCSVNSAAGTFGSETNRDKVTDSAVYKGKLFVAVQETDAAAVYRWDGGTTWQMVTNAVGKVNSGDTANIDGFTMTVYKDMLVIGSQGTGTEAALFYSTDAHTGSTPTWTQANTTKGTFQSANITSVWDIAVYNGMLYLTTQASNAAEIIRWDGGTGFTQVTQTDGKFMNAEAVANIDWIHLTVYNNMLIAGAVTGSSGQARVAAYSGTGVGSTAVFTILNTAGTFDALGSQFDVTNMEVYNGDLYIVTARTDSAGIWRWNGTTPVTGIPTSFKLVITGAGQIVSGDTANIDNIILKTYNGRLYAGTSTGSGTNTGALYEFDGQNTWTLINTTRGTFDGTTNVDAISDLIEYNGTLYVGTEDLASSVGSVYSWSKTSLNSYALMFNSGNSNYGAISFVGGQVVNDNEQHAGSFMLSHSIQLDSAGFDVAEDYASYDMDLHANELVELDPDNREFVRRATKGTGGLIGVVSEEPGFRLAQSKTKLNGAKWSPIALVGRVPVKVTSENGPIRTGDPLTISSIPGVAMKATETGTSIGYAMENYDDEDPMRIGKITVFVNVGYNGKAIFADSDIRDGTVLEDENGFSFTTASGKVIQEVGAYSLLASAEIKAGFVESTRFATQTLTAFQATIDSLIVDTIVGRQATLTDAQIENLNAQALKAQLIEAETIKTATLEAEIATITGTLTAQDATISGTLVADNVDAQNIREMRERLERLALTQSDTTVTSEQLNADIEQVQQYIDELTNTETPENVADVATYQLTSESMSMDPGTTENSLGQEVSSANLDSLIVTGTASMTSLTIADAFSTGNVFIQGNSVVSLVNDLKLSALESVDIMNGAVIIAKDGTITAKGEVIAQKGIRTNTIKSLDGTSDVAVVLDGTIDPSGLDSSHSAFRVQTADGNNVAHIDSSGSADFKGLSLSTYSEATSSAVVIAAGDNYRQTGLYAPAIKTNATASGNGFLPEGENDIIIFNDSIKKDTIVNLTPTSSTQNQSVYVDKVETCANNSNELCQPYFRIAIDDVIDTDVTFNWLIVN